MAPDSSSQAARFAGMAAAQAATQATRAMVVAGDFLVFF